jgi:hypothetical protein
MGFGRLSEKLGMGTYSRQPKNVIFNAIDNQQIATNMKLFKT